MRVSERNRFIRPLVMDGEIHCPFLMKRPKDDTHACRIYSTRPHACNAFPYSPEQAKRIGCRGFEET